MGANLVMQVSFNPIRKGTSQINTTLPSLKIKPKLGKCYFRSLAKNGTIIPCIIRKLWAVSFFIHKIAQRFSHIFNFIHRFITAFSLGHIFMDPTLPPLAKCNRKRFFISKKYFTKKLIIKSNVWPNVIIRFWQKVAI